MLYFGRFFVRIILFFRAHSSVVERYPDKIEVEGPIPSAPNAVMWITFLAKIFSCCIINTEDNYYYQILCGPKG